MGFRLRREFCFLPAQVAAILFVAASSSPATATPVLARCVGLETEPAKIAAVKSEARLAALRWLRDPESARFGDSGIYVRVVCEDGQHEIVCLDVNAKNGFGGYTGRQPLIYLTTGNRYRLVPNDESDTVIEALRLCTKPPAK